MVPQRIDAIGKRLVLATVGVLAWAVFRAADQFERQLVSF